MGLLRGVAVILTLSLASTLALAGPVKQARRGLPQFEHSPFPFTGTVPGKTEPFLDVEQDGRKGHTSPRGGIYWLDETYSDRRVLLDIPRGFDPDKPGAIFVFFHGNKSKLERDVIRRQRVPQQVARAGLNAVLVAPQLAVDALDSTAGRFYEPGFTKAFFAEAARRLAELAGDAKLAPKFEAMPVVLVAYSGGYVPAAWIAHQGELGDRLKGILLFDALYGEVDKFATWIERRGNGVFFSAHSKSSRDLNLELQKAVGGRGVDAADDMPGQLRAGTVTFFAAAEDVPHSDFVTKAWVESPLQSVLAKLTMYARGAAPAKTKRSAQR